MANTKEEKKVNEEVVDKKEEATATPESQQEEKPEVESKKEMIEVSKGTAKFFRGCRKVGRILVPAFLTVGSLFVGYEIGTKKEKKASAQYKDQLSSLQNQLSLEQKPDVVVPSVSENVFDNIDTIG